MNPYLMPTLESGPRIVAELIARVPADRLDTPTHPERFTPREVVAHLADWEPVFVERMVSALERPGTVTPEYDEGDWAIEHAYAAQDPIEQARLFAERRAETKHWLESVDPERWGNAFVHPRRGRMTIEDQANMILGHDLYHIEQLLDVLRS